MRGDNNIRDYFSIPLISQDTIQNDPDSIKKILGMDNMSEFNISVFDVEDDEGVSQNILDRYMPFIEDKQNCFTRIKLDQYMANYCIGKSRSISKYLYGTTQLYYFIIAFNDITHDSELTFDLLHNIGIKVPNGNGLELLRKIKVFRGRLEALHGDDVFNEGGF